MKFQQDFSSETRQPQPDYNNQSTSQEKCKWERVVIETFNIFTLDPIWATIQQFNLSVYNFIYVIVHRSVFPVFNLTKAKPKYPILYLFQINKSSMIELINQDYADFVNLSTNLVGLDKSIETELAEPLRTYRDQVRVRENSQGF